MSDAWFDVQGSAPACTLKMEVAGPSDTFVSSQSHANGFMAPQTAPVGHVAVKRHRGENSGLHYSFFGGKFTVGKSCL